MKHLDFISSIKKGSLLINILLGICVFIFTFGQVGRLSPLEIPAYGNVYEVFLFIATFILLFKMQFDDVIKNKLLVHSILVFTLWLAISLVISLFQYDTVQNVLAVLYFARLSLYFIFLVYFTAYIKKYHQAAHYYKVIVVFGAMLVVIFSLVQYFLYPNIGNIAYAGWDPHLYRLVGLYLDPPVTAAVFILLSGFFLFSFKNTVLKVVAVASLGILFFLTYSRGGFVAILATIVVFSLRKMKFKYLAGFIIATVILLTIIPKNISEGLNLTRTTSIKTRLADYNKAFKIWQKSPLIGIGYNHIRAEKDSYEELITEKYNPSHASASFHSSFLMILVTGGAIAFLLYMLILSKIMQLGSFAFYSTIFLSVYSVTDNLLLHPFILFLWFLLIGITHLSRNEQ